MIADILFAGWFFLPAGIANMMPILAAHTPGLNKFDQPIDGGKTWRGQRIFGSHKTWRGFVVGSLAGALVIVFQKAAYLDYGWAREISNGLDYTTLPIVVGFIMGFGALAGDAIKSFFKRQIGRKSGDSWYPFDQLDYIIGGLFVSFIFVQLSLIQYVWIFIVWFCLHLIGSYIGYLLKLKAKPI